MRRHIRWLIICALAAVVGAALWALGATYTASSQSVDPEGIARAYLAGHQPFALAGSVEDNLELLTIQESPAAYHVRLQQVLGGLPVFGGYTTVNISKKTDQVTLALDRRAPGAVASTAGVQIDRALAIGLAEEAVEFKKPRGAATAEQVYFPLEGSHILAWQVLLPALEPLGDWLVVVQADGGHVLLRQNLLRFDSGQVFDPNPVVTSAGSVPPPSDCDSAANASTLAPQYRTRTLLGIQDGQNKLKGSYVDLTAPGILGSLNPAGVADEPSRNYVYSCDDPRFEEVMVYYHIDTTQRKIQSLGFTGKSSILAHPIPAHAHFDPGLPPPGFPDFACNAYFSGLDAGLHFGDFPARCVYLADTAEDADWIIHEYGHAVQDDQVPGWGLSEQGSGMGEGFGDFLAAAMTGNPCWSEWVNVGTTACAGQGGLRWLGNSNVYPGDFVACPNDPDSGIEEPHCTGKIWGGALWDLVEALGSNQAARDLALTLVLDSHFYLDPLSGFSEAAAAIRQADIDLFGGAHVSTIESVFAGRGIAMGSVSDFPYVYFRIRHTFRGDLAVQLKVGQIASPDCSIVLWSPNPFNDTDDLFGAAELTGTACEPYLPPSEARPWRLEVQDVEVNDIGHIVDFEIALSGTRRCIATDVPVAIPDNGAAVYSLVDCSTTGNPPSTPTPTAMAGTPMPTPTSTSPAGTDTPTLTPTNTPTATDTPTATNTPTPTSTPTHTPTPTPQGVRGDVSCNGQTDSVDALLILQKEARLLLALLCPQNGDVNHSGSTNSLDALLVLQYTAGLIAYLPAGEPAAPP